MSASATRVARSLHLARFFSSSVPSAPARLTLAEVKGIPASEVLRARFGAESPQLPLRDFAPGTSVRGSKQAEPSGPTARSVFHVKVSQEGKDVRELTEEETAKFVTHCAATRQVQKGRVVLARGKAHERKLAPEVLEAALSLLQTKGHGGVGVSLAERQHALGAIFTRTAYCHVLSACASAGGAKGYRSAIRWLERMQSDAQCETAGDTREFDAWGVPLTRGFDWLFKRTGDRMDEPRAAAVIQTMRHFGIQLGPRTADMAARVTAIMASQEPHNIANREEQRKKKSRVPKNPAVNSVLIKETGIFSTAADHLLDRFEAELPNVRDNVNLWNVAKDGGEVPARIGILGGRLDDKKNHDAFIAEMRNLNQALDQKVRTRWFGRSKFASRPLHLGASSKKDD
jgi:hypothetical protein